MRPRIKTYTKINLYEIMEKLQTEEDELKAIIDVFNQVEEERERKNLEVWQEEAMKLNEEAEHQAETDLFWKEILEDTRRETESIIDLQQNEEEQHEYHFDSLNQNKQLPRALHVSSEKVNMCPAPVSPRSFPPENHCHKDFQALVSNNNWTLFLGNEELIIRAREPQITDLHFPIVKPVSKQINREFVSVSWSDIQIIAYRERPILSILDTVPNYDNTKHISRETIYNPDLSIKEVHQCGIIIKGDIVKIDYFLELDLEEIKCQKFFYQLGTTLCIYNITTKTYFSFSNVLEWSHFSFRDENFCAVSPFYLINTSQRNLLYSAINSKIVLVSSDDKFLLSYPFELSSRRPRYLQRKMPINEKYLLFGTDSIMDIELRSYPYRTLDENLNGCNLIEVYYSYIAFKKEKDIYIYKVSAYYGISIILKEKILFPAESQIELVLDSHYCAFFDCKQMKFFKKKRNRTIEFELDSETYGMMDAFDGDPEAYWNID